MRHQVILIFLIAFCMYSCTDGDVQYSCDRELDSWIKNHLSEIQTMNRDAWLNTEEALEIPVYRAFTPTQRLSFWNDKFEEVKKLPWTPDEIAHIELVQQFVNEHSNFFRYEPITDDENDIVDAFVYRWKLVANEKFGWTDEVVKSIIASGRTVINTSGELQPLAKSRSQAILPMSVEYICGCNKEHDFCEYELECVTGECNLVSSGCGWLFFQECNGRCHPSGIVYPKNVTNEH